MRKQNNFNTEKCLLTPRSKYYMEYSDWFLSIIQSNTRIHFIGSKYNKQLFKIERGILELLRVWEDAKARKPIDPDMRKEHLNVHDPAHTAKQPKRQNFFYRQGQLIFPGRNTVHKRA